MSDLKKDQIVYIYPKTASFIENDIAFLTEKYAVIRNTYPWYKKCLLPLFLIFQLFFLLSKISVSKVWIVSFGGYWSLLPSLIGKIFNVPVFIILNGTDCVSFPKYNYGSLRKPLLRYFIKYSYRYADLLLPVSKSLVFSNYTFNDTCFYQKQGFRYFFPNLKTPYRVIPNGFDVDFWKNTHEHKYTDSFITVAFISNDTTCRFKGIYSVIQLASHFKNADFTIVGISTKMQNEIQYLPQNITCYDSLSLPQIRSLYQKTGFYLQLSINEGFGCSLCEAMLSGCVPVGSDVGIIPDIIGQSGFIIKKNKAEERIKVLQEALSLSFGERKKMGGNASNRVIQNYPMKRREKLFLEVLETENCTE